MDNNNPTPLTDTPMVPAGMTTPAPIQSGPAQTPTEMPMGQPIPPTPPADGGLPPQIPVTPEVTKSKGSKMMIWMVVIIIVLIILGVGGYYFYAMNMQSKTMSNETGTSQTQSADELDSLNKQVEQVQVEDPTGDLTAVDQQIGQLEPVPTSSASASPKR